MRLSIPIQLSAGLLALVLAGCQGESPEQPEMPDNQVAGEGQSNPPQTAGDEAMTEQSAGHGLDLPAAIETARSELAERTGVEPEQITIGEARRVTWRDGALGCPEADTMYTQALVEGFYIRLMVDGEAHAYHAGRDGRPFYCPPERTRKPADESGDKPTS